MSKHIALVTGASRGIGRTIAERLASDGFMVIGTATTEAGAEAISAYLGDLGKGLVLNVANAESVASVLEHIAEIFGSPTVLVNNAGITRDNLLMRLKEEDWDVIINTNLTSVFRLSKAVLRGMMKAKYGRIINISSVVGEQAMLGKPIMRRQKLEWWVLARQWQRKWVLGTLPSMWLHRVLLIRI